MADLSIGGRMMVKTLKSNFKKEFNLTLRVYKGQKMADDDATLASLSDKKVDDFTVKANMQIGNFETKFLAATGLKVQVASPDDGYLVNNVENLSIGKTFYAKKE
jgi:hypothetical protein